MRGLFMASMPEHLSLSATRMPAGTLVLLLFVTCVSLNLLIPAVSVAVPERSATVFRDPNEVCSAYFQSRGSCGRVGWRPVVLRLRGGGAEHEGGDGSSGMSRDGGSDRSSQGSPGDQDDEVNERLIQRLQAMRGECSALLNRMGEIENEIEDHSLVARVLSEFDSDRRCFRSVGGVLMEEKVR